MKIDLSKYKLIQPSYIKVKKESNEMYDIKVKDDNTFHVQLDENNILLTHNCDGSHIASLLINLFQKWFPYIIEEKRLFMLITPLVVCDYKDGRKYFYSLEEFTKYSKNKKLSNVNYLKGLGSLNMDDWEYVMNNKVLFQIIKDRSTNKFLEIAFGSSSDKRKKWLSGT